ncbi:MAG: glycosyltransferase N-terminal domain-containing protein [Marinifilaceae bacterium]
MTIIYSLALRLYVLAVKLGSLFIPKAKLMIEGRKDLFLQIEQEINKTDKHIWVHAASLGEFEQGRPVIEEIQNNYPEYKIVITFFSPSGYELIKKRNEFEYIYYMPFDSSENAKRFIEIVNPEKAYFIKYEFWYHFLKELNRKNIPTFIFSTIFRNDQIFFKPYGGLMRKALGFFTHLFVQNEKSIELLKSIGIENCSLAGDTRFDRVNHIASNAKILPLVEAFAKDSKVIVCGSTWPQDEDNLIKFLEEKPSGFKWIIAAHETHRKHIDDIVKKLKGNALLYSDATEQNVKEANVLVIDCVGILSSVYQYANISYIGGGFGVGIHNTLEAATFGLPIIFGPNYLNFKEAVDLVNIKAAFSYTEYSELVEIFTLLMNNDKFINLCGSKSSNYVKDNLGATEFIVEKSFTV